VRRLEQEFAERVGRKHGIAVCNGSAALDAAVAALGLGAGDAERVLSHPANCHAVGAEDDRDTD
jgi:dTDP-4-amino-4,6-dideoxygalactose transaminase